LRQCAPIKKKALKQRKSIPNKGRMTWLYVEKNEGEYDCDAGESTEQNTK
jgi:hypothetical protein